MCVPLEGKKDDPEIFFGKKRTIIARIDSKKIFPLTLTVTILFVKNGKSFE